MLTLTWREPKLLTWPAPVQAEAFDLARYIQATRVQVDRQALWRFHLDRSRCPEASQDQHDFHRAQERALRERCTVQDAPAWVRQVWRELAALTRRRASQARQERATAFNLRKK